MELQEIFFTPISIALNLNGSQNIYAITILFEEFFGRLIPILHNNDFLQFYYKLRVSEEKV